MLAAFDPAGALAATYAASGVTVLVLAPDATVTYIHRDTRPGERRSNALIKNRGPHIRELIEVASNWQ